MADDASITRSVLSEQVKGRLLQAILDGRYPPGARIVETRVAKEFGTSQAPVREALRDLEGLGVVETAPFRGASVRQPTMDELKEAFEVRAILEGHGAALAVERLSAPDFDRLAGLVEQMRAAAEAGDPLTEAEVDTEFHQLIIHHSGNATLERVWSKLEPFLRTYITIVSLSTGADRRKVADRHLPIVEALRQGGAGHIEEAFRVHFEESAAVLAEVWPQPAGHDDADDRSRPRELPAVAT